MSLVLISLIKGGCEWFKVNGPEVPSCGRNKTKDFLGAGKEGKNGLWNRSPFFLLLNVHLVRSGQGDGYQLAKAKAFYLLNFKVN